MKPIAKSLDRPDQRPELPKGKAELVQLDDLVVVRGRLEPGWRWSNDWRPVFGTASCQVQHTGIVLSGRFHFEMDDGTAIDLAPGDVYRIPAGHDAWVVGEEPVRTLDWGTTANAARTELIEGGSR